MLVILRSTTGCNLHCRYCSASCGPQNRRDLTEEDCRLLVRELPSHLADGESLTFLWHGGEPTLLAPALFTSMCGILSGSEGHEIRFQMQTNGFALDDAWLEALARFDVGVGISVDGPKALHDAQRVTAAGAGSHDRVFANVEAMRRRGLRPALLCTVREEHLGHEEELVDWLEAVDLPVRLNPLLEQGRSSTSLSAEAYFTFLRTIFTLALQRGISQNIEPLMWMLAAVVTGRPPAECSFSGRCGHTVFSFGPDTEVGSCNRAHYIYGRLRDMPFTDLMETPLWRKRRSRLERLRAQCAGCAIWRFCHGGCPEAVGDSPDAGYCEARRAFFAWLENEGLALYQQALLRRRDVLREQLRQCREARKQFTATLNSVSAGPLGDADGL